MKVIVESHCDKAMNDWKIIDFVTEVFKAAEKKTKAIHSNPRYRNSMNPHIVLNVGYGISTTNARIEDDKGILANFVPSVGFIPSPIANPYKLI